MDVLKEYDSAFRRLLFDRSFRARVTSGDRSELGHIASAFSSIDMHELEKLARAVRDGLLRGSLGGLGIGDSFVNTIAALGGTTNEVADRFLAASVSQRPDWLPIDCTGRRAGVSVLEAFYGWAATELAQRPSELCRAQQEFAVALLTALTRTPRPGFLIAWPQVHAGTQGWYCVLDVAEPLNGRHEQPRQPVVYAAIRGRYVSGRVSTSLAAIIMDCADEPPAWVGAQLLLIGTAPLNEARSLLKERGLL